MFDVRRHLCSVSLSCYVVGFTCVAAQLSTVQVADIALSGLTFVDGEVPSGTVDGVNANFVLNRAPSPVESLVVHRNGAYLMKNLDYKLTGTNLVFLSGAVPVPGDLLVCSYRQTVSMIKSAGDSQSAVIGQPLASRLSATIKDGNQNPIQGAVVIFAGPSAGPGGTFTGGALTAASTTDATGVALAPIFTANNSPGNYMISAATGDLAPVSFLLANVSTPVALLAVLQSPVPGSTFSGSSVTFTWNDTGASAYWLDVGTALNSANVSTGNQGSNTSQTITNVPTNGAPIYVILWSQIGGAWQPNRYTYTAATLGPQLAIMQHPVPGSSMSGSSVTFTWNDSGASAYWLDVGTALNLADISTGNVGSNTSHTVFNLPTNGAPIYVILWSQIGGAWQPNSYSYTGANL